MIDRALVHLDAAVNEESWEWLLDNLPGLAAALEAEVKKGASPEEVRRGMMRRTGREKLALRLEQAAAHLVTSDERRVTS